MRAAARLSSLALGALTACTAVPPPLQTAPGERQIAHWDARGDWVWHCRLSNDGKQIGWAPLAPRAQLRDRSGAVVGRLEGGPNLVHVDGSIAELTTRAADASAGAGALPAALYDARPAGASGLLTRVSSVQQLAVRGGHAPADGCSAGEHLMAERAVPFVAEFRLYAR